MKKIAILALALAMVCLSACALADGTLRVGMECNYAPFNWTQNEPSEDAVPLAGGGYADGYDVRIAKRVAQELGMELEIVKTEWDGLVPSLTSGMIDAIIAGMSPTEERKVTIDFTDSYYVSDLCIVVRTDSPYASAKSLADFSGAKITGQQNTFHYTVIDQIEGVQKQEAMADFSVMVVALQAGAIDGYVSERPGAISAQMANPELTYVAFEEGQGFSYDPNNVTVAVGVVKGSELTEKINGILAGISEEERNEIMTAALAAQPLSGE